MPTGYTADVAEGKVTEFRDFALRCARGMGALIMMRDDPMDAPIPEEFEPSMGCLVQVGKCDAELHTLESASPAELSAMASECYESEMNQWRERQSKRSEQRQRYEAMLAKVAEYQPPSPNHDGFKKFMREQLQGSIQFDCSGEYDDLPVALPADTWKAKEKNRLEKRRESYRRMHLEEIERTAERNLWIKQLRESLQ